MDARHPLDTKATSLMLMLCLIMGLQQITLKATAENMSPVLQIALRSGISAVLVWLLVQARGERLSLADGSWKPGFLFGALLVICGIVLVSDYGMLKQAGTYLKGT